MGKRDPRKYVKISNEEFKQYLDDPKNIRQLEVIGYKYKNRLDQHTLESLKYEGLWLAIGNHDPEKSSFSTYLNYTVEWLVKQHISAGKYKQKLVGIVYSANELDDYCTKFSKTKSNIDLGLVCQIETIENGLRSNGVQERDIKIFFAYHEGYKARELAIEYNCSLKNISRIINRCRNVLETNAIRTELSLQGG